MNDETTKKLTNLLEKLQDEYEGLDRAQTSIKSKITKHVLENIDKFTWKLEDEEIHSWTSFKLLRLVRVFSCEEFSGLKIVCADTTELTKDRYSEQKAKYLHKAERKAEKEAKRKIRDMEENTGLLEYSDIKLKLQPPEKGGNVLSWIELDIRNWESACKLVKTTGTEILIHNIPVFKGPGMQELCDVLKQKSENTRTKEALATLKDLHRQITEQKVTQSE